MEVSAHVVQAGRKQRTGRRKPLKPMILYLDPRLIRLIRLICKLDGFSLERFIATRSLLHFQHAPSAGHSSPSLGLHNKRGFVLRPPVGQRLDIMDSSISAKNVQLLSNPTKVWKDMGWVNKHMRMDSKAVVRHSNHRCRQDTDLRVPTALIYNLLRRPVDLDHLFKSISDCLKHGFFDLDALDSDVTSDYQTLSSFADNRSWADLPHGSKLITFEGSHRSSSSAWHGGNIRPQVGSACLCPDHKNGSQLGLKAEQSLLRPCDSSSSGTNDGDSLLSSDSSSEFDTALVDSRKHVRTLDEEKKAVVNRLMQAFLRDLDTHLSEPSDTPHDGNSSATSSACRGLGSSATSSTTSSFSNKKRSRQDRSDYRRGDEDGREEKPSKKQVCEGDLSPMRFACQYFKWNPRKYNQRPCSGPGWKSVHHVKDHLYRHHRAPKHRCARCQEVFSSNADVGEHARAQPPCEVRLPIPMEEFGQEQEDRIRARLSRKPGERRTERERWSDDFQILFDVRDDDVPTPWYDYDLAILSQKETFNEYLRREIIPIMRREIEQQVESYMSDVEPQILSRFRGIIRNLRPPLWESYQRKISQGTVVGELGDDAPPGNNTTATNEDAAVNPGSSSSAASFPSALQAQAAWTANVSLQPFSGNHFDSTFFPEYNDTQTVAMQQDMLGPNFSAHPEDWEFLGDASSEGPGYNFDTI